MKAILQKISQYSKAALTGAIQNSGTATLYLGTSTLLAAMLLAAYLSYAWDIDRAKWYRALAVLQGIELDETQQAARNRIIEMSFDEVLERRAERLRQEEFDREITGQATRFQFPPEEPPPQPPPPPSDADRISAYEKRVQADQAKSQSAGLEEQTRVIEEASPDWAKDVILILWKDGATQRVLQMLMAMEDKPRAKILYAMQTTEDEEAKKLCEILQKIGDGDPMTSILKDAAKEP